MSKKQRQNKELLLEQKFTLKAREKRLIIFKGNASELKGIPDRIIFGENGLSAFVELKKVGGVLSREQILWKNRILKMGHQHFEIYEEKDFFAVWKYFGVLDE